MADRAQNDRLLCEDPIEFCTETLLDTNRISVASVMRPIQLNFATTYLTDGSLIACAVTADFNGETRVNPSGAATP